MSYLAPIYRYIFNKFLARYRPRSTAPSYANVDLLRQLRVVDSRSCRICCLSRDLDAVCLSADWRVLDGVHIGAT